MPGTSAAEIVVAAGKNVWTAPVGTAAPATAVAVPAAAWKDLGHVNEDGIQLEAGGTTEDVPAWTAATPVRVILTAREFNISFNLLQWNTLTMQVAFGGGAQTGAGPYTYTFPADNDVLPEYAMLIDWVDGTNRDARLVIPRVVRTDNVSANLIRTAPAALAVAFKKLASAPAFIMSADPAFAATP